MAGGSTEGQAKCMHRACTSVLRTVLAVSRQALGARRQAPAATGSRAMGTWRSWLCG
jgi:hypothetical protein